MKRLILASLLFSKVAACGSKFFIQSQQQDDTPTEESRGERRRPGIICGCLELDTVSLGDQHTDRLRELARYRSAFLAQRKSAQQDEV